jgi:hypothetical protein
MTGLQSSSLGWLKPADGQGSGRIGGLAIGPHFGKVAKNRTSAAGRRTDGLGLLMGADWARAEGLSMETLGGSRMVYPRRIAPRPGCWGDLE